MSAFHASSPGLASPMALSMPARVHVMRGKGLPGRGSLVMDLVTMAPRRRGLIRLQISSSVPAVPEAKRMGEGMVMPQISVDKRWLGVYPMCTLYASRPTVVRFT